MKGFCKYRGEIIMRGFGGWFTSHPYLNDVYKTRDDALNAVDNRLGGQSTAIIPKRRDKPVRIIGKIPESDA